eukprot:scaffold31363_cov50-Prasinocladus_malaysianus.AAC.1
MVYLTETERLAPISSLEVLRDLAPTWPGEAADLSHGGRREEVLQVEALAALLIRELHGVLLLGGLVVPQGGDCQRLGLPTSEKDAAMGAGENP